MSRRMSELVVGIDSSVDITGSAWKYWRMVVGNRAAVGGITRVVGSGFGSFEDNRESRDQLPKATEDALAAGASG